MKIKHSILQSLFLLMIGLLLNGCATPKPLIATPQTAPPLSPQPAPRVTVILGGGGSRAFAHLGVLQVLRQYHVPIDMIVATNTGSIVGTLYAAHNNLHETKTKLLAAENAELLDVSALHSLTGTLSGNTLQKFILKNVRTHDLRNLYTRTVLVATDLKTGQPFAIESGPIAPAVNAASALPPYFQPVHLYGHWLIDGTITDPIPVDIAMNYHPKITIAVDLAAQLDNKMPTNIVSIYDRVYYISDNHFNQLSAQDADVLIHPKVPATYEPNRQQRLALIKAGINATQLAMPQICALLQKNAIASACSSNNAPKVNPTPPQKENLSKKIKKTLKTLEIKVKQLPHTD